ncbi:MAG: SpoIIE family protein phosphatase [Spirochaetota bacterium]
MRRLARLTVTLGVFLFLPSYVAAESAITNDISAAPAISADCEYKTNAATDWLPARKTLNLGLVEGNVVIRCRIANPGPEIEVVLEIASPWIDRIELLAGKNGVAALAGEQVDPEMRQLPSRNPAFRVPLKNGTNAIELLVQANGSAMVLPMRMTTAPRFELESRREYAFFGAYFGALLILALVSGVFGVYSRDTIFFPYALGIFTGCIYFFIEYGLPGALLGLASPHLNTALGISSAVTFAVFTDFHRRFLQALAPLSSLVFQILCLAALAIGVLFLFSSYAFCIRLLNYFILLADVIIFAYFVKQIRTSRYPLAYSLAWLVFLVSTFASILVTLNVIGAGALVRHNISLTFLLQAVLFSMAIGSRHKDILIEGHNTRTALNLVEQELTHAQEIHRRILPRPGKLPLKPFLDVHYTPLGRLGGDFYTFEERAGNDVVFFIADVQGHGLPAALDASSVKIAFQQSVTRNTAAAQILSDINRHLGPHLDSRFVSAQVIRWQPQDHQVEIASAGHPYPILCMGERGGCHEIGVGGPILGLNPDFVYEPVQLKLQKGEFLLVYTDGLIEDPFSQSSYNEDLAILMVALAQAVRTRAPASELASRMVGYHTRKVFSDDVTVMVFWP